MTKIKKVLIVKTSSMGDIINTLPAITDAGYALPTTKFDWVIEKNFCQIPNWHPKIRNVISINCRYWKQSYLHIKSYTEYYNCLKKLKHDTYDVIIDAQGLIKSAFFITLFAKGEKHGMNYESVREPIASLCYNKKYKISKKQHTVERIRQLFSYSLKYPLPPTKGEYCIAQNFKIQKITHPYLILFYNTTNTKKHWPESNWKELIQHIITLKDYYIKLPYWSEHEKRRTQRLIHGLYHRKIIILHELTLQEIAQQIASAHAIISVDTGLSHLSTALSRPILTLYGPTSPKLNGIYGNNTQWIISSKTKRMNDITTEKVWKNFQKLLYQIKI